VTAGCQPANGARCAPGAACSSQAGQPLGRDQTAEPRRARVDRLVAAGHPVPDDPFPDDRVDAVGTDHDRGVEGRSGRAAHPQASAGLFQFLDAAAEVQVLRAERAGQQPLQGHPVQPVERRTERLAVPAVVRAGRHRAAVAAVAMDEPGGFGRYPGEVLAQAQVPEHPGGVGGQADRRPGLVQFGGLLEHLGGDAALPKQERQREPADPGPDDHHRRIWVRHHASPRSYPARAPSCGCCG